MDLTSFIRSEADVEQAKALVVQERFFYQPFRIAADLEVGGGYEFMRRRPGAGMVYWPYVVVMMAGAIAGGYGGAGLARRMGSTAVRRIIIVVGFGMAVSLYLRG